MSSAPRLRSDFAPALELYPFNSRWFDGPHGRMHFVNEGVGQPILLLHGNPTWSFLYRKLIPELVACGFRCIAPDLLGYGLSEHPAEPRFSASAHAHTILALIEGLALERFILVGQDWGGPIGLGAAVAVPERVRGIVLGSTFAWRTTGLTRFIARVLRTGVVQRWMVDSDHFIERVVRAMAYTKLSQPELDHYQLVADRKELRVAKAVLPRELIDADAWLTDLERRVQKHLGSRTTLLVHPEKDGALGWKAVQRFTRLFPEHQLVRLPNARHFFQEDAPERVAQAIHTCFG